MRRLEAFASPDEGLRDGTSAFSTRTESDKISLTAMETSFKLCEQGLKFYSILLLYSPKQAVLFKRARFNRASCAALIFSALPPQAFKQSSCRARP
ncbi:hypothetical protein Lnau_0408 [Legionella nautarum]|uniref:Uncharacterized protein n=1 Tax=Legionella nautarum TaxID=45070 RepID=A0A0W0X2Y7_9GAMM|nr:hypothetical protein Lnau_0408 [Legionella nautarum]